MIGYFKCDKCGKTDLCGQSRMGYEHLCIECGAKLYKIDANKARRIWGRAFCIGNPADTRCADSSPLLGKAEELMAQQMSSRVS